MIVVLILCLISFVLTWQSARGLGQLRRELQRHAQGRDYRLAEQAKAVK